MLSYHCRNVFIAVAILAGLTPTAPASAVIREAVYTGRISYGYDQTTFFGVGTNLTNTPYHLRFRYDTTIGTIRLGPGFTERSGGPYQDCCTPLQFDRPTPMQFADLTINGITKRISGNWAGRIFAGDDPQPYYMTYVIGHMAYQKEDSPDVGIESIYQIYVLTDPATRNLETLQPELAVTVPWWGNTIWIRETHWSAPAYNINVYALMQGPATVQISNAVPEPAGWMMLIAGFGLIGAQMRRRQVSMVLCLKIAPSIATKPNRFMVF